MESLILNHAFVKNNAQLAEEIDTSFQKISPYLSRMLTGVNILSDTVGAHIHELCLKTFSPEEVVSAESLESLQVIAREKLAIKALYNKWQQLVKSNT